MTTLGLSFNLQSHSHISLNITAKHLKGKNNEFKLLLTCWSKYFTIQSDLRSFQQLEHTHGSDRFGDGTNTEETPRGNQTEDPCSSITLLNAIEIHLRKDI